ncbi:uncharacterized protein LOC132255377 [Phlebotomus argentipes]|uniref:uncharacterized protein LOC132255377 n=1 Tax=Phlebotomus argentipes TaxID=94469 RepID=UPI002892D58E|nr:uncharacterized protein LOC132255377 [Phlebotomus argentipes]
MCKGVFRVSPEDQMYFSRVLRCPDETHERCCTFQVTVSAERSTKSALAEAEVTTDAVTTESATEDVTTDTEDARFDFTTEIPTTTEGVLVIYPTEESKNSSDRRMRAFQGDQPEDDLILVFPVESPRETRATLSNESPNLTTQDALKATKKFRYNNVNRKRFMPILKINETQLETPVEGKPVFKVANSENRKFLEELYRNRTRFGTPASQITSTTPRELLTRLEMQRIEDVPEDVKRTTQRPRAPKRNLYYDPTKRKGFVRKNATREGDESPPKPIAVDSNHRDMIEEVLSELKRESNSLVMPSEMSMNPAMAAKFSNMQKRLIDRIVDRISTRMERREDFDITASTKREQSRPFRGSMRYADTVKSTKGESSARENPSESERRKGKKQQPEEMKEFSRETPLPADFRPSPLWTLQRGEDPFPIPQVPLTASRESRDVVPENHAWRQRGFVPIPQIPRNTPIQIIGPIPKSLRRDSSKHFAPAPSDLPSESAPPHFRRLTGEEAGAAQ